MNTKEKELIEKVEEITKGLKFLRKKAGYEPNAWYEGQEEKLISYAIRTAVADTEKQVMEKYNSIGRVVEESSKMQLDKWEAAIRVDERRKIEEEMQDFNSLTCHHRLKVELSFNALYGNICITIIDEMGNYIHSFTGKGFFKRIKEAREFITLKEQKEGHGNT